jgi:hypothetical protein
MELYGVCDCSYLSTAKPEHNVVVNGPPSLRHPQPPIHEMHAYTNAPHTLDPNPTHSPKPSSPFATPLAQIINRLASLVHMRSLFDLDNQLDLILA